MKKITLFLIAIAMTCFLYAGKVFAADVSVSAPETVNVGQTFEVDVNATTDGVLINSADIVLSYDKSSMVFSGYKSDGTVIGLWVKPPTEKNGNINMSGIIPGGVSGVYDPNKKGLGAIPLVRLLFTATKEGDAKFSFVKTEILQHDGSGTKLNHAEINGEVLIKESNSEVRVENQKGVDTEKPEPFKITLLESSALGQTPLMITFKANDVGSGIKEYKMSIGGSNWQNTQSPQTIEKAILGYTVTIRAYDFNGNFEDSHIEIPGLVSPGALCIVIALLAIFCFVGYKVIKYRNK